MPPTHRLADISDVVIKPLSQSIYIKPFSLHFKKAGRERCWDILSIHDSVSVIIYNTTRNVLVMVKQFRPAVYFNSIPEEDRSGEIDVGKYPPEIGITIELCAGIVDKDIPLEEIAKEEVMEECGYLVSSLERIGSHRTGVGTAGSKQTAFYCEVTDEMKVASGGGVGTEDIEIVEMTIPEITNYISQSDIISPAAFLFNIYWFLRHKANKNN